jgi:hypothetical protein
MEKKNKHPKTNDPTLFTLEDLLHWFGDLSSPIILSLFFDKTSCCEAAVVVVVVLPFHEFLWHVLGLLVQSMDVVE